MGRSQIHLLIAVLCLSSIFRTKATDCPFKCNCTGSSQADCSNSYRNRIPIVLNADLEYLNMGSNNLLPERIIEVPERFPRLISLNLSDNYISSIPDRVFNGLNSLQSLYLGYNGMKRINTSAFLGLDNLKLLDLEGNLLDYIEPGTFQNTGALNELLGLNLERIEDDTLTGLNELEKLDITIAKRGTMYGHITLPALLHLTLHFPNLKVLDRTRFIIRGEVLSGLKHFKLIAPGMRRLPKWSLLGLHALEEFSVQAGNVSYIMKDFFSNIDQFKDKPIILKHVTLEGIKRIPGDVFNSLSNLDHLVVNFASGIPQELVTGNSQLHYLDLALCSIDIIRNEWCSDFLFFNISYNEISHINKNQLSKCTSLETLDISNNLLQTIDTDAFSSFSHSIKHLNLSHNRLLQLPKDLLTNANQLETLNLETNFINEIIPGSFDALVNLVALVISSNKLCCLNVSMFSKLNNLRYLDLSKNDISEIYPMTFVNMADLTHLDISDNLFEQMPLGFLPDKKGKEFLNLYVQSSNLFCTCSLNEIMTAGGITIYGQCKRAVFINGRNLTSSIFIKPSSSQEICPRKDDTQPTMPVRLTDTTSSVSTTRTITSEEVSDQSSTTITATSSTMIVETGLLDQSPVITTTNVAIAGHPSEDNQSTASTTLTTTLRTYSSTYSSSGTAPIASGTKDSIRTTTSLEDSGSTLEPVTKPIHILLNQNSQTNNDSKEPDDADLDTSSPHSFTIIVDVTTAPSQTPAKKTTSSRSGNAMNITAEDSNFDVHMPISDSDSDTHGYNVTNNTDGNNSSVVLISSSIKVKGYNLNDFVAILVMSLVVMIHLFALIYLLHLKVRGVFYERSYTVNKS